MHRQRAHHEDVTRVGVDRCELLGAQLAQLPVRYDTPQVTPRNQLKRASALIGRIEMKPKRNQATERFSHRLAVGYHARPVALVDTRATHPRFPVWCARGSLAALWNARFVTPIVAPASPEVRIRYLNRFLTRRHPR